MIQLIRFIRCICFMIDDDSSERVDREPHGGLSLTVDLGK